MKCIVPPYFTVLTFVISEKYCVILNKGLIRCLQSEVRMSYVSSAFQSIWEANHTKSFRTTNMVVCQLKKISLKNTFC